MDSKPVLRIRMVGMHQGFFVDPDPGFKSPDPSIYKTYVI